MLEAVLYVAQAMLAPVAVLTALIVAFTFAAEPLVEITQRAAEQLLQREPYVRAVLGGG